MTLSWVCAFVYGAKVAKTVSQWRRSMRWDRLLSTELVLEQAGLEFTLEDVERQIWWAQCCRQTVPRPPRSADSEAGLASWCRDLVRRTTRVVVAAERTCWLPSVDAAGKKSAVGISGLRHSDTSTPAPPSWKSHDLPDIKDMPLFDVEYLRNGTR